ncbi:MAG: riboflavin synthase [Bdellovibrionales bacterium]
MFTGLVEATAKVLEVVPQNSGNIEITVEKPSEFNDLKRGHSVAHNGVCLTVKDETPENLSQLTYDLGLETLKITTFSKVKEGDLLNLERPLMMGERLHGHLVTGHVDEVCEVKSVEAIEDGCAIISIYKLTKPEFVWSKGSIVINGVSLTINDVFSDGLSVCLVPETLKKTNLSELQSGDKVNIEYDFYAKGVIHASNR